MIKKILKVLFLSDKRKAGRKSMGKVKDVLLFSQGKSFHVANLSLGGIGIIDQGQVTWTLGQEFMGDIEIFMTERARIQGKVVRIKDKVVGIELGHTSSEFKDLLKKLRKK